MAVDVDYVCLAADSYPEQVRRMQTTHVLVGVHGAALTHALVLPRGRAVVELHPVDVPYFALYAPRPSLPPL